MDMEQITKKEDFLPLFQPPSSGDLVKGTIIGRGRLSLFVDLGPFGTGVVYGKEFFKAKKMFSDLEPGKEVKAKVLKIDGEGGYTEVSITKAREEVTWRKLEELKETKEPFTVKVTKANKGGLIANVEGINGFLPVSHLRSEHYPKVEDGDSLKILHKLQKLIGEDLKVVVLTVDPDEESLILSEKEANTKEMKEILANYEEGDVVKGKITGVVDFGAFIKFPYPEKEGETLEGLIHISELDWQLIEDPKDVVEEGDVVEAKIIEIKNGRISLSLKALKEDPWKKLEYEKGDVVKGKVTKFNPFGAFVKIKPKVQGLIHISEFGTETRMKEELEVGKEYDFEISMVDAEEHRMILTLAKDEA